MTANRERGNVRRQFFFLGKYERVFVRMDVVRHTRQNLDLSSRGTTSVGPEARLSPGIGAGSYSATCYLVLLEFLEFLTSAIAAAAMSAAPPMMKRCVPMPPVDGSGSGSFGVNSQDPVNFTFPASSAFSIEAFIESLSKPLKFHVPPSTFTWVLTGAIALMSVSRPYPAGSFGSRAVTSSGSSVPAVRLLNSY